uniref:Probable rhamnose biosynthetic enzyme 1 n=2 Tax=Nicotiana sylvestris TaxID=4096 RepID=A0A1U7WNI9_NICSY|nr:PREDICTED: probable rhamnose biosynthetic enzyme 1 [Nicotiana sylvestris]
MKWRIGLKEIHRGRGGTAVKPRQIKWRGRMFIVHRGSAATAVNCSMPISAALTNPRNFITKITRYNKVVNIPNSMTILDKLLPISLEMTKRNLTGICNFTNPGVVSNNEILEMYRDNVNPSFSWKNFTHEEQAKVIVAPNNELDTSKMSKEFPEMKSIKESLIEYVFKPNRKTRVA